MCTTFTEHVRDFGPTCDPAGCVLPRLEQLLRQRMRRRNLLSSPPSHLGYSGMTSWDAPGAFEDIIVDCYIYAFLDRLTGLRNQLRARSNIDGMISRNVDNFLLERQRRNDPVGYAVFGNVEGAAADRGAAGELAAEGRAEGRLHNSSVLYLDPLTTAGELADPDQLRGLLAEAPGWAEIVPHLATTTDEGQLWVAEFLRRLRAAGVVAVRVGDLVSVLAALTREDSKARHGGPASGLGIEGDDEVRVVVRLVWPDNRVADRDQLEMLKRVVPEQIGRLYRQQRVRDRLARVFQELVRLVEAGGPRPPSQADLVRELGVPRETISADFGLLREVISGILPENPDR